MAGLEVSTVLNFEKARTDACGRKQRKVLRTTDGRSELTLTPDKCQLYLKAQAALPKANSLNPVEAGHTHSTTDLGIYTLSI